MLITLLLEILGSQPFRLFLIAVATIVQLLITKELRAAHKKAQSIRLLQTILLTSIAIEIVFFLITLAKLKYISSLYLCLFARLSWVANIIYHVLLAILFDSLLKSHGTKNKFFIISRVLGGAVLAGIFTLSIIFWPYNHFPSELALRQAIYFYMILLSGQSIGLVSYVLYKTPRLPRLLKHQLTIFTFWLVMPQLCVKFLFISPIEFIPWTPVVKNIFNNVSMVLLTYSLYFCATRLVRFRFLNIREHVVEPQDTTFVGDFRRMLDTIGQISNISELRYALERFFASSLHLREGRAHLFLCDETDPQHLRACNYHQITSKLALDGADTVLSPLLKKSRILIRDEVEFSAFYNNEDGNLEAAQFLSDIRADIFLPFYDRDHLIGFLVVDEHARPDKFYSEREREEMLVVAAYLAPIVNLLRNRNIESLLAQKKTLENEVRIKHEENNQYRESLRSFLRDAQDRKIGLLFHRSGRFVVVNEDAQHLLHCDPNMHHGHPVVRALKTLVAKATRYRTTQTMMVTDLQKRRLALSAVPEVEKSGIAITIAHAEIADIVKQQIDLLQDPSTWDYLLYLETTSAGRLINELLPGTGEKLLNFKIELLRHALSNKPLLLQGPEEDLRAIVQLLHTTNARSQLHLLKLKEKESDFQYARQLFGINPLLEPTATQQLIPLLESLDKIGTLHIENPHYLAPETQQLLARFLKTGTYQPFRGEQRFTSDVRVICTIPDTSEKQHICIPELLHEFKKTTLSLPTLATLPKEEFEDLLQGLALQVDSRKEAATAFLLDRNECSQLYRDRLESVAKLKKQLRDIIAGNERTHAAASFIPANRAESESLQQAVLLGKKALRDKETLELLWNQFKSQTKIATLLGVNRSSVSRRLRECGIGAGNTETATDDAIESASSKE